MEEKRKSPSPPQQPNFINKDIEDLVAVLAQRILPRESIEVSKHPYFSKFGNQVKLVAEVSGTDYIPHIRVNDSDKYDHSTYATAVIFDRGEVRAYGNLGRMNPKSAKEGKAENMGPTDPALADFEVFIKYLDSEEDINEKLVPRTHRDLRQAIVRNTRILFEVVEENIEAIIRALWADSRFWKKEKQTVQKLASSLYPNYSKSSKEEQNNFDFMAFRSAIISRSPIKTYTVDVKKWENGAEITETLTKKKLSIKSKVFQKVDIDNPKKTKDKLEYEEAAKKFKDRGGEITVKWNDKDYPDPLSMLVSDKHLKYKPIVCCDASGKIMEPVPFDQPQIPNVCIGSLLFDWSLYSKGNIFGVRLGLKHAITPVKIIKSYKYETPTIDTGSTMGWGEGISTMTTPILENEEDEGWNEGDENNFEQKLKKQK